MRHHSDLGPYGVKVRARFVRARRTLGSHNLPDVGTFATLIRDIDGMNHVALNPPLDPAAMVAGAVAGNQTACSELLASYGALVWSLCRRLDPEPEDAYQDVWERVVRALARFDPAGPAKLSTWIATIAHRRLVDRHRRRLTRGVTVPLGDPPSTAPSVERQLDDSRRREQLERAIQQLPDGQRRTVIMHYRQGLILEDIADNEGVAVGTVKSRLHRARAQLTALLWEE